MPLLPVLLLASLCADARCPVQQLAMADRVTLKSYLLKLGDVADLSPLPSRLRIAASNAPLLRLDDRVSRIAVPKQLLFDRARRTIPALAAWLPSRAVGSIELDIRPVAERPAIAQMQCLRAKRPVAARSIVRTADFMPATCPSNGLGRAFRFDAATETVQATRTLTEGDIVPRFRGYGTKIVARGDSLRLQARSGPVVVTRNVEALQSADEGSKIFVRTTDGEVLVARVGALQQ